MGFLVSVPAWLFFNIKIKYNLPEKTGLLDKHTIKALEITRKKVWKSKNIRNLSSSIKTMENPTTLLSDRESNGVALATDLEIFQNSSSLKDNPTVETMTNTNDIKIRLEKLLSSIELFLTTVDWVDWGLFLLLLLLGIFGFLF